MTLPPAADPSKLPDAALGLDVPLSLQASIGRHRTHLAQLAASLRAAGMPDAKIESSVNTLIASYRAELILALKSIRSDDHVAD